MPTAPAANKRRHTPPHVSIRDLRLAIGYTLDDVVVRIAEATGKRISRGTLSAIETGEYRASAELLADISSALGMRSEALTTDYLPARTRRRPTDDVVVVERASA